MKTMYERWEEQREEKLYFLRQRLFALIVIATGLAMFWMSTTVIRELGICAIVLLGLGFMLMFTKHRALG